MTVQAELSNVVPLPGVDVDFDLATPAAAVAKPQADPTAGLTGRQKAAVLVLQLGKEESKAVLNKLSESELEELSGEIARIGYVKPDVASAVMAEFAGVIASGAMGARGGLDLAHELLLASVGPERATEIIERLKAAFQEMPFAFLQGLDARQIISFLSDEHPQTIALVLAHMAAGPASDVLAGLDRDLQADVAHRIAVMDRTSPDLIRHVESALERRLSSMGVASDLSAVGGVKPLVEIINRADRSTERLIMEGLEQRDPDIAEQVRSQMFMFEDVLNLEDRAVQMVLREVQISDLATALKGVNDQVKNKIMRNMSERAALTLTEEIELLGPVRVAVVEEAQAAVVRAIRQLEDTGQIVIGRGDEDAFVA